MYFLVTVSWSIFLFAVIISFSASLSLSLSLSRVFVLIPISNGREQINLSERLLSLIAIIAVILFERQRMKIHVQIF
jgi:hypothetical protein